RFKRATVTSLLISSIVALVSISVRPQTLVSARILSSDGAVEITRRQQGQSAFVKIDYRVNDELVAGDVIKTAKGARLVLGLTDGSQAIIGEKTTVEITDLSQSPRTIFNVLRGKTRIKIEKVGGRPNPYRVNTPTAVIAVRGTLFDVLVSEKETQVFVHEGQVAVSGLKAPNMPVLLDPGQKTRVPLSETPEAPSSFQPGRNNESFTPRFQPDREPNGGSPVGGNPNGGGQNNQAGNQPPRNNNNQPSAPSSQQPPPPGSNGPGGQGGGGGRHP
ncbi:MAG: FecR domain-containing protein, partial [Acidobacteria bacterium]|nr:FecR domain-containing protein [Acidobacteriota bacterium]